MLRHSRSRSISPILAHCITVPLSLLITVHYSPPNPFFLVAWWLSGLSERLKEVYLEHVDGVFYSFAPKREWRFPQAMLTGSMTAARLFFL